MAVTEIVRTATVLNYGNGIACNALVDICQLFDYNSA